MKICLDAGHGGVQPGAVYHDLEEKTVNLAVVAAAERYLRPEHQVIYTRIDDRTLSLQERCDIANEAGADAFVSIHCNADPDVDEPGMPEARGEEIWYAEGSVKGERLARCLADEVDRIFPDEPFRGIKATSKLYVLIHTRAPAVLIEIGFIDRSSSTETFEDPECLERIGMLVAEGIHEYLKAS